MTFKITDNQYGRLS